jgi:hypothetical protein
MSHPLDDTPHIYFTKEDIEQIVEEKVYEVLERIKLQDSIIDDELIANIEETGAGERIRGSIESTAIEKE